MVVIGREPPRRERAKGRCEEEQEGFLKGSDLDLTGLGLDWDRVFNTNILERSSFPPKGFDLFVRRSWVGIHPRLLGRGFPGWSHSAWKLSDAESRRFG